MENKEYLETTFPDGTPVKIYPGKGLKVQDNFILDDPTKEQIILAARDSGKSITLFNQMKQVNTITKSEYPLLFSFLAEYDEEPYHTEREHRRGSSFYVTETYFIDEDTLNEFKQEYELTEDLTHLLGYWQANRIWSEDWGFDSDFDCLSRVERKVRVIEEEYFEQIETPKAYA